MWKARSSVRMEFESGSRTFRYNLFRNGNALRRHATYIRVSCKHRDSKSRMGHGFQLREVFQRFLEILKS